jgi:GNAT superfamily N-acetyltransferase
MQEQTPLLIRVPQRGDGPGLAQNWLDTATYYAKLNSGLFQLHDTDGLADWCEARALNSAAENTCMLVAERNEQIVGFVRATVHPPHPEAGYQLVRDLGLTRLVIDALVVQSAYWRQGIGTHLMNAVEGWGRSRGAVVAQLDTSLESPVSVPFYEQGLGYTRRALHFRKTLV